MQLGAHPFFKSFLERAKVLGNNPVVEKVGNLREDIRERWETTENPTVQRFQVSSSSSWNRPVPICAATKVSDFPPTPSCPMAPSRALAPRCMLPVGPSIGWCALCMREMMVLGMPLGTALRCKHTSGH